MTGQSMDYTSFAGSRGRGDGGRGGYAGAMGGATPSRVPDWSGSRTPLRMAGGRTPAWGGTSGSARSKLSIKQTSSLSLLTHSSTRLVSRSLGSNPSLEPTKHGRRPHPSLCPRRRRQPNSQPLQRRQPHRQPLLRRNLPRRQRRKQPLLPPPLFTQAKRFN